MLLVYVGLSELLQSSSPRPFRGGRCPGKRIACPTNPFYYKKAESPNNVAITPKRSGQLQTK